MKLSDFIVLTEEEKKLTVLHQGVLVAKRTNYDHMVFLFQIESYYVEAWCSLENKAVEEFRVFDNVKPLNPYLEKISIDELLN